MNNPHVRLEAPEFAREGTLVEYSISVENTGDAPLELHLQGREIVFDLSVVGDEGRIVWRRLEGKVSQAILRVEILQPGESFSVHDTWDQKDLSGRRVAPGFYTLQASLPTDAAPLVSQDRLLHITSSVRRG